MNFRCQNGENLLLLRVDNKLLTTDGSGGPDDDESRNNLERSYDW
jgi:hypothetical protein